MVKINYVIATWAGKNTIRNQIINYPKHCDELSDHLKHLSTLDHNLAQITIMKPKCPPKLTYPDYYKYTNLDFGCPVVEIDCPNFGYSNGQWMTCYEKYRDQFDYYICVEDDYCPGKDHFDQIILKDYREAFPDNVGKLCGFVFPEKFKKVLIPPHYESVVFTSHQSFEKMYAHPKWKGDPKSFLEKQWAVKNKWNNIGPMAQVNFSALFRESGMELKWLEKWDIPYYDTRSRTYFLNGGGNMTLNNLGKKILFQPVQMIPSNRMKCFKSQKTCILVVGNHRSGTSALSGCLNMSGLDVGKNQATHKNIYNKHGFFENLSILNFNDGTLKKIGSWWNDIKPFTQKQEDHMMKFEGELREIIKKEYDTPFFLIKDPRIIFLYPLYLKVLDSLNVLINVVYIDRPFKEISASLQRAQKLPPKTGMKLCKKYKDRGNALLSEVSSIQVHYHDLLKDPVNVIRKIGRHVKVIPDLINCDETKIRDFIDPSLQHFKS